MNNPSFFPFLFVIIPFLVQGLFILTFFVLMIRIVKRRSGQIPHLFRGLDGKTVNRLKEQKMASLASQRHDQMDSMLHSGLLADLPSSEYRIVENVSVATNFATVAVLAVVFSRFGLFVVTQFEETGTVYGSEYSDSWQIDHHDQPRWVRNPIKANFEVIDALAKQLNVSRSNFIPIVVYGRHIDLDVDASSKVVPEAHLGATIADFSSEFIAPEVVDRLYHQLVQVK